MLQRLDDVQPASIEINTPADLSYYSTWVEISGRAIDTSSPEGPPGAVESLSYEVLGTALGGEVPIAGDGGFTFGFPALGLSGTLTVRLTALDWNGNRSVSTLTLLKGASDIPLLGAVVSNKSVTLSWDPVAMAQSYVIHYTGNGTPPSSSYGMSLPATSPQRVDGLRNGAAHMFQLEAVSSQGPSYDAWSAYLEAIPVSPATLKPRVRGEYGRIRVSWPVIPGTDRFEVWRSTSQSGVFSNISGLVTGNRYWDYTARPGIDYFYRVQPYGAISLPSHADGGRTSPFTKERVLSLYNTPGYAYAIATDGETSYIADETSVIAIDTADPASPFLLGSLPTPGGDHCQLAARDGLVVLADGSRGLALYDFSDPAAPAVVSTLPFSDDGGAYGVALVADCAYVSTGLGTVKVVDLSDPAAPTTVFTLPTANAIDIAMSGTRAFVLDGQVLRIYGASDPRSPTAAGSVDIGDSVFSLAVCGDHAYVASWEFDLVIVDVSDPAAPAIATTYTHDRRLEGTRMAIEGNALYIGHGSGSAIVKLDISNPLAPAKLAEYESWDGINGFTVLDGAVRLAESELGMETVVFGEPTAIPGLLLDTPGTAQHVRISGDHALVADRGSGLCIVDISQPAAPVIEGTLWFSGAAFYALDLGGTYAYIVNGYEELLVVDWNLPGAPVLRGRCPLSNPQYVFVHGDYAYVADDYNGLTVVDISDPDNPFPLGTYITQGSASRVAAQDRYAFVLDYDTGLFILDIGNPVAIKKVWQDSTAQGTFVHAEDDRLFVGYDGGRMDIWDIGDPSLPVKVGSWDDPAYSRIQDLAVVGDYAFLADQMLGLQILDISDPALIVAVRTINPAGSEISVAIRGGHAYLANGSTGLMTIDLYP